MVFHRTRIKDFVGQKLAIHINLMVIWAIFLPAMIQLMAPALAATTVPESPAQIRLSFAPVVKKVAPAVVNIYATRVVQQRNPSPTLDLPFFMHFYGDIFPYGDAPARVQQTLGSGVIVRPDGIVVTNLHVIRNAQEIKVVLSDGREFDAEVVVKDPRTDLAALRIKNVKDQLPTLELRDADEVEVGDLVLAIGNPFGFSHTVTNGIVSATARTLVGANDFRSFIQTDAAINQGNSGGALVTLDGKLIGINASIFSEGGGNIGIGFAIPSNLVAPVIAAVDHDGNVVRPWAGVSVKDVPESVAKSHGLATAAGAMVTSLYPEGPGANAGLEVGDIIVKVNNKDIQSANSFLFRIAICDTNSKAIFSVRRGQNELEIPVTLEAPPALDETKTMTLTGRHPLAGATVADLSPALATEHGFNFMENGVAVLKVHPGSPSQQIGLMPGDIIAKINDREIHSLEDLARNITRQRGGWLLEIHRGRKVIRMYIGT